jgi:hypothetical protein
MGAGGSLEKRPDKLWIVANLRRLLVEPADELLALFRRPSCGSGPFGMTPNQFVRTLLRGVAGYEMQATGHV